MSCKDSTVNQFVPIMEISVASLSAVSIIPLFIVLLNTAVLHPNCRTILLLSQLAQFGIVTMQIALVVYEFSKDVYLPDTIDGEELYLFAHEFAYAMSTMLALFLTIERFVACLNARTYESSSRSYIGISIILVVSIPFSVGWSYMSHSLGHYYIGIAIIFCAEIFVMLLSFALFFYSKRLYLKQSNISVSLRERYQTNEIVQYSRAFVPSLCVSSLLKIIGLIPVIAWQEGWGQYGFMRALFFTAHSINCAVMKNMLLIGHSALRRAFLKTFAVCCPTSNRVRQIVIVVGAVEEAVNKATNDHFEMLCSAWN